MNNPFLPDDLNRFSYLTLLHSALTCRNLLDRLLTLETHHSADLEDQLRQALTVLEAELQQRDIASLAEQPS